MNCVTILAGVPEESYGRIPPNHPLYAAVRSVILTLPAISLAIMRLPLLAGRKNIGEGLITKARAPIVIVLCALYGRNFMLKQPTDHVCT
ncbi:MAG: hypothetical protein C7B43_08060 [Sulfobacillus benefaciens]|jgi:hypothetical protein|uniref:Uncharacterized protein n=1 Tax=Sulfobacillus benefaciens TaxID=453960 RepID=A0A2T2X517_9FIRM|nr:MAG: hypothetical protein C7B43_08060 [Sulfobacillus benefaciens]HBQ96831.1 hypothetical protein [Sulfobacillus sp.]